MHMCSRMSKWMLERAIRRTFQAQNLNYLCLFLSAPSSSSLPATPFSMTAIPTFIKVSERTAVWHLTRRDIEAQLKQRGFADEILKKETKEELRARLLEYFPKQPRQSADPMQRYAKMNKNDLIEAATKLGATVDKKMIKGTILAEVRKLVESENSNNLKTNLEEEPVEERSSSSSNAEDHASRMITGVAGQRRPHP